MQSTGLLIFTEAHTALATINSLHTPYLFLTFLAQIRLKEKKVNVNVPKKFDFLQYTYIQDICSVKKCKISSDMWKIILSFYVLLHSLSQFCKALNVEVFVGFHPSLLGPWHFFLSRGVGLQKKWCAVMNRNVVQSFLYAKMTGSILVLGGVLWKSLGNIVASHLTWGSVITVAVGHTNGGLGDCDNDRVPITMQCPLTIIA